MKKYIWLMLFLIMFFINNTYANWIKILDNNSFQTIAIPTIDQYKEYKNSYINLLWTGNLNIQKNYQLDSNIWSVISNTLWSMNLSDFSSYNARFLRKEDWMIIDNFLEWWFYKLNVWAKNYSYINSFYAFNPVIWNFNIYIKSFLDINRDYQSISKNDWLANFLKRTWISTKYLWFLFIPSKSLNDLNVSINEWNIWINNYLQNWTNKNDIINDLNSINDNSYIEKNISLNWNVEKVYIIPFQKNPYFWSPSFETTKFNVKDDWKYYVYKAKNSLNQCWNYAWDVNGDWIWDINLRDYYSYIYNCWFEPSNIIDINNNVSNDWIPYNDKSFMYLWNINNNFKVWAYPLTFVNIYNLFNWFDKYSDNNLTDWFSINYWFLLDNNNLSDTQSITVVDSFLWKFTNEFLDYYVTQMFNSNWLRSLSYLIKIFVEQKTLIEIDYSSISDYTDLLWKTVWSTIKKHQLYWHYRNIKDLDSLSFWWDRVSSLLWVLKENWDVISNFTIPLLNWNSLLIENLWDSSIWYKKVSNDRNLELPSLTSTSNCSWFNWINNKYKCVSEIWKNLSDNNDIKDFIKYKSDPWYINTKYDNYAWTSFEKFIKFNTDINDLQFFDWITWKPVISNISWSIYNWSWFNWQEHWSVWTDLEKIYIWLWSKNWYTENWWVLKNKQGNILWFIWNIYLNTVYENNELKLKIWWNENITFPINDESDITQFSNFIKSNIEYDVNYWSTNFKVKWAPFGNYIYEWYSTLFPLSNIKFNWLNMWWWEYHGLYSSIINPNLWKNLYRWIDNPINENQQWNVDWEIYNNISYMLEWLDDKKIANQNSYWVYFSNLSSQFQHGLDYTIQYKWDSYDNWIHFGFNSPILTYNRFDIQSYDNLFPYVWVEWKQYNLSYYDNSNFTISIWDNNTSIIDDWIINNNIYLINFNNTLALSHEKLVPNWQDIFKQYTWNNITKWDNWSNVDERNHLLRSIILQLFTNKNNFDYNLIKKDLNWNALIDIYVWAISTNQTVSILVKVTDTLDKEWYLPIAWKSWKIYFYNKLSSIALWSIDSTIIDSLNNYTNVDTKTTIMNGVWWLKINMQSYKQLNSFSYTQLTNLLQNTYVVYNQDMYLSIINKNDKWILDSEWDIASINESVSENALLRDNLWWEALIFEDDWSFLWYDNPESVFNFLKFKPFDWKMNLLVGLENDIWKEDNTTIWKNKFFMMSLIYPKKDFVLVFDNKNYNLLSAWGKLISNIIWNNNIMLSDINTNFSLNSYFNNYINNRIVNSLSNQFFNIEYMVTPIQLKNTEVSAWVVWPYKIGLLPNFQTFKTLNVVVEWDNILNWLLTTRLVCDWSTIINWTNNWFNINDLNIINSSIKNCDIEILLNNNSINNLSKITWKRIKLIVNWTYIDPTDNIQKSLLEKSLWIEFNDILFLTSLPYATLADIPVCQLVTKNKDTIDEWDAWTVVWTTNWSNVIIWWNINWSYENLEFDVLYKNPNISNIWLVDKKLLWMTVELEVNWNAKFDNFNNEYINLLNWNFESNYEKMWLFTQSIFNKLKTNTSYSPKKIKLFIPINQFKKDRFFWKTTFIVRSDTLNLNQYKFTTNGKCVFHYEWEWDDTKNMDGMVNFQYKTPSSSDDSLSIRYYNADDPNKSLQWIWFSKIYKDWKAYLIKQYSPSFIDFTYIHNWNADNINKFSRVNANFNWDQDQIWANRWTAITNWQEYIAQWFSNVVQNNAPYNWSENFWFSIKDTFPTVSLVNTKAGSLNWRSCKTCCWKKSCWSCAQVNHTILTYNHYNNILPLPTPYATLYSKIMNNADAWINWVQSDTIGKAYWWYYWLKFNWQYIINKKKLWNDWLTIVDRIIPQCLDNSFLLKYRSKLVQMNNENLYIVDQWFDLMDRFLQWTISSVNWCQLSYSSTNPSTSNIKLETLSDNTLKTINIENPLNSESGLPWMLNSSSNPLPLNRTDVQTKEFQKTITVDKNWQLVLYVPEWFKKEITNVRLTFKINKPDISLNEKDLTIYYDLEFDLKTSDKTWPNSVKDNLLYYNLDKGNKSIPLYSLHVPVLFTTSFSESYWLNENNLINKLMFMWDDANTKESIKTSVDTNVTIASQYKKFTVSEYRQWFNTSQVEYAICSDWSRRNWFLPRIISTVDNYNNSSANVIPYVVWKNNNPYSFKNDIIKWNFVNTVYQFTDNVNSQIANKTIMVNGIPSLKWLNSNQILYQWFCSVCWSYEWNIYENASVWMFNKQVDNSKQWITNMFKYYTDDRYFAIKRTKLEGTTIINEELKTDFNDWQPFVNLITTTGTNSVELVAEWVWSLSWAILYQGKKAVYIKWVNADWTEKPVDLVIQSDIIPKEYNKFWTDEMINDELVIVTDWDIIIWSDVSMINAILMTKWNIIVLPWNNSFKLHWWAIVNGYIMNYRTNITDINTTSFANNYKNFYTNIQLYNLKYPMLMTLDPRYLNSKIFNIITKVSRETSN